MEACRECSGAIVQTLSEYACSECGLVTDMFVTVESLFALPPDAGRGVPGVQDFKAPGLFSILFPDAGAEERVHRAKDEARALRDASIRDSLEFGNAVMASLKLQDTVQDEVRDMFRKLTCRGIFKAERRKVMLVSCIYHACQASGSPRTVKELIRISGVRMRLLLREIGAVAARCKISYVEPKCAVDSLIARLIEGLDIGSADRRPLAAKARALFREAGKDALQGRGTNTLAALYIYRALAAANVDVPASAVAKAAGVSTMTLKALL